MPARRKTKRILNLSGNYRKSRHSDRVEDIEPEKVKAPTPPEFIKGESLKEWNRISSLMLEQETICELNMATLTQYCIMWSDLVKSLSDNDKEPLPAAFHTAFRLVTSELGITPVSRSRVISIKPKKTESRFKFERGL